MPAVPTSRSSESANVASTSMSRRIVVAYREDERERELREEHLAEGVGWPDERASGDRTREGPEPADHDDDERVNERVDVHAGLQAEHRRGDDAREASERGADRERDREEAI